MLEPTPRVVLLPGLGLVTAMKDKANAVVGNLCYRHVMRVAEAAEALGGFRFLDDADAIEFEYWPLELAKLKQSERELSRQVALITGAASGIGRAIAERFAAEGAHLVLTDIAGPALRETAAAIGRACKDPQRVVAVDADATRAADTEAAFDQAVLAFGGVDILVCNAGFIQAGPADQMTEETWDRHFDLNVKGYFLAARAAVRAMKLGRGGVIIFNASKGAFAPTADNAAYASSKAAVAALARNLATELGTAGIRVNYFNADFVDTPLMQQLIAQRAAHRGITAGEADRGLPPAQRHARRPDPAGGGGGGGAVSGVTAIAASRRERRCRSTGASRKRCRGRSSVARAAFSPLHARVAERTFGSLSASSVRQPGDQGARLLRPRRRRLRLERDVLFQMRARLRPPAQPLQRHRQIEVRVGEVGCDLQHAAQLRDGQLEVALLQDQVRQVEAPLGLIGVERQRRLEAVLGPRSIAATVRDDSQIGMRRRQARDPAPARTESTPPPRRPPGRGPGAPRAASPP